MEAPDTLNIFAMRVVSIRLRLGVHASRPDHSYGISNVIRSQAAGEDNRDPHLLDDAAADTPVVRSAEGADLMIRSAITGEQQKVDDFGVVTGNRKALLA